MLFGKVLHKGKIELLMKVNLPLRRYKMQATSFLSSQGIRRQFVCWSVHKALQIKGLAVLPPVKRFEDFEVIKKITKCGFDKK